MPDLFDGGPPTRSELERWLRDETDASPADITAILARYNPDDAEGLSEGDMRAYLAESYQVYEVDRTPADTGAGAGMFDQPDRGRGGVNFERQERYEAAAAAAEARRRRASIPSWLEDEGPSVDPGALATSIAVGVFTDDAGNPVVDPDTGQPRPVNAQTVWEAIRGTRFDMGSLNIRTKRPLPSDEREGATRVARQIARRRFVTPSSALALLNGFDEDYLISLQQQMWEAGLYGEDLPSWGQADEATRRAFMGLFGEASLTPDEPIDRVIARMIDERVRRAPTQEGGRGGADVPTFQPEVASAESLGALIDDIAQNLRGEFASPEERASLIKTLQDKEIAGQRQAFDQQVQAQGGAGAEIDAFMAAISGQESGGNYNAVNAESGASGRFQIMPQNWGPWSERAGLGRNAPRTPANQDAVARFMMGEYYRQFGNWRDVAIAWYAGPGRVGAGSGTLDRSQGRYPTINAYADKIMERFAALRGQGPVTPGGEFPAIERFDPASEAAAILKAQDPAGWEAHSFADRAIEFYSLLGGVV